MNPRQKRVKATHNKEACEFINSSGKFPDWVITTAFYSALHFLEAKALPFKARDASNNRITITHLSEYKTLRGIDKSLHHARLVLLREREPQIATDYKRLFDLCHLARYVDHKTDQADADTAISLLNSIADYCK